MGRESFYSVEYGLDSSCVFKSERRSSAIQMELLLLNECTGSRGVTFPCRSCIDPIELPHF